MKIEIWEEEYYPVLSPRPTKRRRAFGVYEIGDNIYKEWVKVFNDFHNVQAEIKKMLEKAERKRRRSICGYKLEEK